MNLDRMTRVALIAGLALAASDAGAETATRWHEHPNSRVRLVAHDPGLIGVEVLLAPGWKTYWRMPGDAGVPPSFEWGGSVNLAQAEPLYPIPSAMAEAGGVAIGYKSAVTFPVRLTRTQTDKPTTVTLAFSYGVCREICIPIDAQLSLDLPSAASAIQTAKSIAASMARVPMVVADASRTTPALVATTAVVSGDTPVLRFETRGAMDVFVEAPDGLFLPMPRRVNETKDVATFEIDLRQAPDLPAMLGRQIRVTLARADGGIETTVTLPAR